MINNTTLYSNFKPIKISNKQKNKKEKISLLPVIGATAGVGLSLLASKKIYNNKPQSTLNEVSKMLLMAGSANIGAVALGSINKNKEQRKTKVKEAAFQMMNTTIPMLMVTGALETCKRVNCLNKKAPKIIASFCAMALGAMSATKITNMTKGNKTEKRKYTIKDSVANFDDIIATIAIGFRGILKYVPVDKILPFIYIYCGSRAGSKGDSEIKKEA